MDTFVGGAVNDVYGKLYFHVKGTLTSFHQRVQSLNVSFHLFHFDAKELLDYLSVGTFARIEVSPS